MTETVELLNCIHANARIGLDALGRLIKQCEDATFRNVMAVEFAEYNEIVEESEELLKKRNQHPKGSAAFSKTSMGAGLKLNVLIDKTSSHMAEMILLGSTMGIIDMTRHLNEFPGADEEARALGEKLLKTEENNFASMREHL